MTSLLALAIHWWIDYSAHYHDALMNAIRRRIESGEVVPVKSARGAVAYVRVEDLA